MSVYSVLREWNLRPDKALGQNFLVEEDVLEKIADAADLSPDDIVVEIGAGTGALTGLLAERAGHVVALELDQRLIPVLESELCPFDNVTIRQGDVLDLDPTTLVEHARRKLQGSPGRYQVVGNLPYYITSAILRHLLEADPRPDRMVVTVQYEVAKRIVAEPGDMSVLAVSVRFYGQPELLFRIKSGSFYPAPTVDSAVVRLDVDESPPLPDEEVDTFFEVVRAGFSQRRKQLHNAISAGLGERISKDDAAEKLDAVGVDHRRRAQTLSVDEWIAVTRAFSDEPHSSL
jgi:16S rRNA (adenine1518-N6/adenine1519-N6)-dimethyltransferase